MTETERNALVVTYLPLVRKIAWGLISRNVPGCVELDDVVQDAVLYLIPELDRYQPKNGAKLDTYLHWVIRRDVVDSMRRQMRKDRYNTLGFNPADTAPTWILGIERREMKKYLTPKQLQAVELVYVYGFTQEQAAVRLSVTSRAIRFRLSSANERIKNIHRKPS